MLTEREVHIFNVKAYSLTFFSQPHRKATSCSAGGEGGIGIYVFWLSERCLKAERFKTRDVLSAYITGDYSWISSTVQYSVLFSRVLRTLRLQLLLLFISSSVIRESRGWYLSFPHADMFQIYTPVTCPLYTHPLMEDITKPVLNIIHSQKEGLSQLNWYGVSLLWI